MEITALPPLPALKCFSMQPAFAQRLAFESTDPDANAASDAAFLRALGARAPALADVCLDADIDVTPRPFVQHSSMRWRHALEYVAGCRRGTGSGAPSLCAVTVSVAVSTLSTPDLHAVLDLIEYEPEAQALHPLIGELRALPGTPKLLLHVYRAGDNLQEGPVREIFQGLSVPVDAL
jgi:hypothetical protein